MRSYKIILASLLLFSAITLAQPSYSQCAQCVATVETNRQTEGDGLATGLNHGIMYLLAAPYLAIGIVGFIWYRKFRRKNVSLEIRSEKLNLN